MRALMMDFADDKKVWDMNDEYMFGKSILVAPIVEAIIYLKWQLLHRKRQAGTGMTIKIRAKAA